MLNARNYTNPKINEFYHRNFVVGTDNQTVTIILCIEGAEFIIQNINGAGSDKTMSVELDDGPKSELETGINVRLAPFTDLNIDDDRSVVAYTEELLKIKMEYIDKNFEDHPDVCEVSLIEMDLPETEDKLGGVVVAKMHQEVYAQIINATMFNIGMFTISEYINNIYHTKKLLGVGYDSAVMDGVDESN